MFSFPALARSEIQDDGLQHHHMSPARNARILVVSPETNFFVSLKRILGRCGSTIEVVESGERALERASHESFDAIVSQVQLPGAVCGVTLLNQLRAHGLAMPVVLLTEKQTERLKHAVASTSGVTCMSQHADLDSLKSTLAACLLPASSAAKT
jgi:CheY-like chemotaxis protein